MEESRVNDLVDRTKTDLTAARDEQFRSLEERMNSKI